MPRRRQVLISGPGNSGKTTLALEYGRYVRLADGGDILALDYQGLMAAYQTTDPEVEDPSQGVYYFDRVPAPTLYEVRALVAALTFPTANPLELVVEGVLIQKDRLRTVVVDVIRNIAQGRRYGTLIADPVGQLADDLVAETFDARTALATTPEALAALEKMRQPMYGYVRKAAQELLYGMVQAEVHLVFTAESKGLWVQSRRQTDEGQQVLDIPGIQKKVLSFMELALMLEKRTGDKKQTVYPSNAVILKSKIRGLPEGMQIDEVDWEQVFSAEPRLSRAPDPPPDPLLLAAAMARGTDGEVPDDEEAGLAPDEDPA